MRIARYVRVSRVDQRAGLQHDETAEFIARRGWTLVDTCEDKGVSGAKAKRPELDRLLALARSRKIDAIVVYRSDRLFRSMHHMVSTMAELDALGVGFVSVTEPFDTTTPSGRLLLHVVASMAEFERTLIQERTRDGLAAAKRRGSKLGRPRARFDLDAARDLQEQGKSLAEIAAQLGTTASTLCRRLAVGAAAAVHVS